MRMIVAIVLMVATVLGQSGVGGAPAVKRAVESCCCGVEGVCECCEGGTESRADEPREACPCGPRHERVKSQGEPAAAAVEGTAAKAEGRKAADGRVALSRFMARLKFIGRDLPVPSYACATPRGRGVERARLCVWVT